MTDNKTEYWCCNEPMVYQPSQFQYHCSKCKSTKKKQNSLLREVNFGSTKPKTNPSQ